MDASNSTPAAFYVCHHDPNRYCVTSDTLSQALEKNYDSLTTPITTNAFQTRVTALLSDFIFKDQSKENVHKPIPTVPSLGPTDTLLGPGHFISQLLGIISPWIDLCSPDPAVYQISKQVLEMEVAFAAFCGMTALVLPPPKLHHGSKNGAGIAQYAHAVKEVLVLGSFIQFSISSPMMDNPSDVLEPDSSLAHLARAPFLETATTNRRTSSESSKKHDFFGSWDAWNIIRDTCLYHSRLFVALMVPRYLPHSGVCARWHSEPLRVLMIDSSTFFANPNGYPVLTSNHRALISQYMRLRNTPCIVLTGVDPIPGEGTNGMHPYDQSIEDSVGSRLSLERDESIVSSVIHNHDGRISTARSYKSKDSVAHLGYLRWFQANQPPKSRIELGSTGYEDFLQAPLQPLAQNLESVTYEVFEQDPVKYDLYERAIAAALRDWKDQSKPSSNGDGRVVLAVVGAGRGPLVARALKASAETGVSIDLWALEKNPNAFVLLRRQNSQMWNDAVKLVKSDMRSWKGPVQSPSPSSPRPIHYPIDILVSELLGSFADNELSPECLDGITHLLNPTHGISIPQSYSAWLTPISAPKLHSDLLPRINTEPSVFNTPYVVMLQSFDYLSTKSHTSAYGPEIVSLASTEPRSRPSAEFHTGTTGDDGAAATKLPSPNVSCAWSFEHNHSSASSNGPPPSKDNSHNARHVRLSFDLRHRAVCHGLAGYFESVLYPGFELSTNPLTMAQKSADMMSWFPIFFPLRTPLYTPDHSSMVVDMFRATDGRKVWYEWVVEGWTNNAAVTGGAGYRLGSSGLMSSKEQACLM